MMILKYKKKKKKSLLTIWYRIKPRILNYHYVFNWKYKRERNKIVILLKE